MRPRPLNQESLRRAGQPRKSRPTEAKHERFAQLVASGMAACDALVEIDPAAKDISSRCRYERAHRLILQTQERVTAILKRAEDATILSIIERKKTLTDMVRKRKGDVTQDNALRAITELNKMDHVYEEQGDEQGELHVHFHLGGTPRIEGGEQPGDAGRVIDA